jgi:hypothetical protein
VLTGSASREELEEAGAPHILDSVTGLLPLLGLGSGRPLHAHRAGDDNGSTENGSADSGSADNGGAADDNSSGTGGGSEQPG